MRECLLFRSTTFRWRSRSSSRSFRTPFETPPCGPRIRTVGLCLRPYIGPGGGGAFFVSEVPMYRLPPTTHALTLTTYHVIKRQFLIYGPEQSNHQPQTESTPPSTFQMHDVAVEKTIVFEVFSKEASSAACRKHSLVNLSGLVVCRSLFGLADLVSPGFFSLRS